MRNKFKAAIELISREIKKAEPYMNAEKYDHLVVDGTRDVLREYRAAKKLLQREGATKKGGKAK